MRLAAGLLFLPLQQRVKADAVDREDTVAGSGKVAVRLTFGTANSLYLDFIVFVYKVQCAVPREERGHGLSVLYDLGSHAFANSTVRLSAFHANLLEDNGLSLRRSLEGV